jgi:hypothetical protein
MLRQPHQVVGLDMQFLVGIVRVRADRAPDVVVRIRDCRDGRELVHEGGDRHHAVDAASAARASTPSDLPTRVEIEMTVAIDQHLIGVLES